MFDLYESREFRTQIQIFKIENQGVISRSSFPVVTYIMWLLHIG